MIQYKVVITRSAKEDILERKRYILENFKYRQLAENFSEQIQMAVRALDTLPNGYASVRFTYKGYKIRCKPHQSCLIFYAVDEDMKVVTVLRVLQDRQDWEYILKHWLGADE